MTTPLDLTELGAWRSAGRSSRARRPSPRSSRPRWRGSPRPTAPSARGSPSTPTARWRRRARGTRTSRPAGRSGRSTASRSGSRTSSTSPACRRRAARPRSRTRSRSTDARLVARLRAAGAVIVGKTVATQFAYKDPAPTTNPWSAEHTPGGSSSGSAAAVAARQVPAAIGTQTVGSILRPSAFCGVVGLKGAHGDVPLDGVLPLAPSLDHGGPDHALRRRRGAGRGASCAAARWRSRTSSGAAARDEPRAVRPGRARSSGITSTPGRAPRSTPAPRSSRSSCRRRSWPLLEAGSRILEAEAAEVHAAMVPRPRRRVRAADRRARPRRARPRSPASRRAGARRSGRPSGPRSLPCSRASTRCCRRSRPGPRRCAATGTGDFVLCAPWSFAGRAVDRDPDRPRRRGPAPRAPADRGTRPPRAACSGRPRGARRRSPSTPGRRAAARVTTPLWSRSATWLARAIAAREVSSLEVVDACLARIDAVNPRINARRPARRRRPGPGARGRRGPRARRGAGPLHGVPFTIKDSLDTAGVVTTAGTVGWRDRVPARDATVVARLRAAGGILLGKTNTPEFTWANETDNDVYGRTSNPYDLDRTPGGSSGGSASIVAAGGSPFDIGSDSGNSIRQPAHLCGVAGIKPTSGRVPRTGHWPGFEGPVRVVHAARPDRPAGRGPRARPADHRRPRRRGPARRPGAARRSGEGRRRRAAGRLVRRQRDPDADARDDRPRSRRAVAAIAATGAHRRGAACRPTSPTARPAWEAVIRADGFAWLWRLIEQAGTPGHGSFDTFGWVTRPPRRAGGRRRR